MLRLLISRDSRRDLREIIAYISKDSGKSARKVAADIHEAFQLLREFPDIGHLRQDLTNAPYRFWRVHSYLIVYHRKGSTLRILRVLSASRDIPKLLP